MVAVAWMVLSGVPFVPGAISTARNPPVATWLIPLLSLLLAGDGPGPLAMAPYTSHLDFLFLLIWKKNNGEIVINFLKHDDKKCYKTSSTKLLIPGFIAVVSTFLRRINSLVHPCLNCQEFAINKEISNFRWTDTQQAVYVSIIFTWRLCCLDIS